MFHVSQDCLELGLRAGAIVLRDIRITDASAALRAEMDAEIERIRRQFASNSEIRAQPELIKHHEILRKVGVKPRSHPPSTQKLLELAFKRGTLPAINNLVDTYNLISIRTKCSLGAHDLDQLATPVDLCLFRGDEHFRPLGSDEDKEIRQGEFGYVDAERRVVCRLDSLQADFSKVTHETVNALLIIEATTVHSAEELDRIFAETRDMIHAHCGGTSELVSPPFGPRIPSSKRRATPGGEYELPLDF